MTAPSLDEGESNKLTLNLISGNDKDVNRVAKRKRGHEDNEDELRTEDDQDREERPVKKKRIKRHDGEEGGQGHGHDKQKGKDVISSLFNHNPEIPRLNLVEVTPAKEEVFTGKSFDDVGLHPFLVKALKDSSDIDKMTAVQAKAIPAVLAGKDALIKSQTGSGKTLAYALPIMHRLQAKRPEVRRGDGIMAVVVVPTRELAQQTFEWVEKLCRSFARIVPGILVGGEKKKSEKARIRKGINILIATPGRMIDHIKHTKMLSLSKVDWLVFDEADRILELGYERDIQAIITAVDEAKAAVEGEGQRRQTLLLSATLTTGIEQLSEVSMKHPMFIDAAEDESSEGGSDALSKLTTPETLNQTFLIIPAKLRLVTLASFIVWKCRLSRRHNKRKILVFMSTQDMVDFHANLLNRSLNNSNAERIDFLTLHGSMSQQERVTVFHKFRGTNKQSENDLSSVLVCTDVASRGLDLPSAVDWVVQYNAPVTRADYVHRVGRTARAGAGGSSLLMLLPSEAEFVRELEQENLPLAEMTAEHALEKLPRDESLTLPDHGRRPPTMEEAATGLQLSMENAVVADEELHKLASQAYVSFVRSYASYPKEVRHVFCFKELHLGHLAKSFALRDPPSQITGIGKGQWVKNDAIKRKNNREIERQKNMEIKQEEKVVKAQKRRINQKALVMSEFQSGFEGIELKESAKNVVKGQTKKKSKVGSKLKREDWMKRKAARKAMVNSKVGKK